MEKIDKLKELLSNSDLDAYIIPMADEFGSEFLPPNARVIEFLSSFTGSNAKIIIPSSPSRKPAFFTDGRYGLQAKQEVDESVFDIFDFADVSVEDWLNQAFKNGSKIGFNSLLFSYLEIENLDKKTSNKFEFRGGKEDYIDKIWGDRPLAKFSQPFILEEKYSGESHELKIDRLCKEFEEDFLVVTDSLSICWLLNIRGSDLPSTPVFFSHAIISKIHKQAYLYGNKSSVPSDVEDSLSDKVTIKDLSSFFNDLNNLPDRTILVDKSEISSEVVSRLEDHSIKIIFGSNPITLLKAIKNDVEIEGIKKAHVIDGASLSRFLCWLENEVENNKSYDLTEYQIGEKLKEFRAESKEFVSTSFDTIAGFKSNGAIVHYRAEEETSLKIESDGMLLIDSGGQYKFGTTDVTRTIYFGEPTAEQKEDFTLVLKGHIAIASAKFPSSTSGAILDSLARIHLWKTNKDYKHGTGHGVGHFLNVHEGPQGISRVNFTPLQKNMILSNEPGFYKEGEYGIRIESLVYVDQKSSDDGFLSFETVTICPIEQKLIKKDLLNSEEIDWLNNYHLEVHDKLLAYMKTDLEKNWLKKKTQKI